MVTETPEGITSAHDVEYNGHIKEEDYTKT